MDSSDAISVTGTGSSASPFIPELIIDPASNELVVNPTGLDVVEALKRAANPARGVMRRYDSHPLTEDVSYQIEHQTALLGGTMAMNVARSHYIIPYDGFYDFDMWTAIDNGAGAGSDACWMRIVIYNEDTGEELATNQNLCTFFPGGIDQSRTALSTGGKENLSAGDKITTEVKVSESGIALYAGTNGLAYCSKFSICYVGPSAS